MISRTLCLSFLGLMMLQRIRGELLYKDVIEAKDMEFGSLESGIMKINPQGPLNLLLGFLAHKLGLDYNMRMYFSEIEPKFKNDKGEYERCWREDKGVGDLGKVLIDLFPSHGGSLSVSSNSDTSFSTSLTKDDRDKGVKFMAALMVYSLGGKLEYKEELSKKNSFVRIGDFKIEKLKKEAAERVISIIKYLKKPDSITGMGIIERFVKSKRFPLLSFVFMFLDSKEEMENFLNTFFSLADKGVVEKCFVSKDYNDGTNYKLLSDVVSKVNLFPFSELNPPPSNMSVNAYSRSKNSGKGGFLNVKFSDCGEISILEFVCCVFFNPETSSYPIDKLEKASPDLKNFFSTRESLFEFDMECRREWFKVVQDRKDSEGRHDTRINYVRKCSETEGETEPDKEYSEEEDPRARNEIEPGFLNLLSILRSIWNPDDPYLPKCRLLKKRTKKNEPKDEGEISETMQEFEEVFKRMVSIINSGDKSISIEYDDLQIGVGLEGGVWDIYGNIVLTIGIKGLFEARIKLKHSKGHAEITIIKTKFPEMIRLQKSSRIANNLLSSDNELDYLIGKYVVGCISPPDGYEVLELVKENVYNGFSNGCLNNSDLRLDIVRGLHSCSKDLDQSSDACYKIHEMISNIIANSTLSDKAVQKVYGKFFFISDSIFEFFFEFVEKDEDKAQYFLNAISSNICRSTTYNYLKKNYEFIFMNEYLSTSLVTRIILDSREDLFKIIEENQAKGYPGLYIAKFCGFDYVLGWLDENEPLHYFFAKGFLDMISKDEIIRDRSRTYPSEYSLKLFLRTLKESEDIDEEKEEKLFCYYFYDINSDHYDLGLNSFLEILMEEMWDSASFPIDFVSDCIVRRPDVYFCKFYEMLLESILKRSEEESNRIELGEDAFTIIEHVVEFICDDQNKNEYSVGSICLLAHKLGRLLGDVEEKELIRPVCFNKDKLIRLATGYLRSAREEEDFELYVSSVNEVMKESNSK